MYTLADNGYSFHQIVQLVPTAKEGSVGGWMSLRNQDLESPSGKKERTPKPRKISKKESTPAARKGIPSANTRTSTGEEDIEIDDLLVSNYSLDRNPYSHETGWVKERQLAFTYCDLGLSIKQIMKLLPNSNYNSVSCWMTRHKTLNRQSSISETSISGNPTNRSLNAENKELCFDYLKKGYSLDKIAQLLPTVSAQKIYTWEWLFLKQQRKTNPRKTAF